MDTLDLLINDMREGAELSAEAHNALHGCLSYHPWGIGKSFEQRKLEALMATAGRVVNRAARCKLEKLSD